MNYIYFFFPEHGPIELIDAGCIVKTDELRGVLSVEISTRDGRMIDLFSKAQRGYVWSWLHNGTHVTALPYLNTITSYLGGGTIEGRFHFMGQSPRK